MAGSELHTKAPPSVRFAPGYGRIAAINQSLILWPIVVTVWLVFQCLGAHQLAVDFHHDFWVAGSRVAHGLGPYDWSRSDIAGLQAFPYPAPAALLFVPISLLSHGVSDLVFVALLLAAGLGALRVLEVRDWRVYTVVLLWCPVINAWQTGNVTLLLACGAAAVWRYRDTTAAAGVLTGLLLCLKPVVWPLTLWLLVTRRFRAAAYALAVAAALNLVSWSVLGFGQLAVWWHLLSLQTDVLYRQGYALTALAVHFGAGRVAGTALQIALTATVALACWHLGWRASDRPAFTVAVALVLVSSPLLDNHYFALLLVPLAIARPRLSPAWFVPLVLWLCPATQVAGWQVTFAWLTFGGFTAWLVRGQGPGSSASSPRPRCRRRYRAMGVFGLPGRDHGAPCG